ncbi:hypothetical protein MN116_002242 [Schistosoma mekongi]|uniref:C2 domain-containing protein n=1 Tax=Schistosoma mekongi TaxID=38744 RepID=A0AAE1ZJS9_SCHME|nr:hypothetical protein MN116_002242 [Schistosoma mekongi]
MTSGQSNIKDTLLVKMSSQYDDPYLWINNYLTTPLTNTEVDHLKTVMQRDQAIKKTDTERIYDLVGSFPSKLQPEIIRSNLNQLRNKYPAIPGSGFVSICTSLIQLHNVDPIKAKKENLHLHYTRKRKSCVTFTKCKFQSTFSKLCPICLQTYNSLLETNQCIQCGQNVCKNCAYKIASITNSDILCKECWDIAKFMCKTGDWFNQYTKSKPTSPLKIDVKFKPLQNNKPCIESGELNPAGMESPKYNANLSVKEINGNNKASVNRKSIGENHHVMKQQLLRSKSVQNLKTQSLLNDSKTTLQTTQEKTSSGFINRSVLSYSHSFDNLSNVSDASIKHKEFHPISKRKKRILKLKKLMKRGKIFKSHHSKTSDKIDGSVSGEIDVSLEYNVQDQQLGVGLWNAYKLMSKTYKIGLPHATITLLPDNVKYSLKVTGHNKWDGRDAVFNHSVCFTVHKRDLNKKVVVISLWSRKGIKSQFTIGQTVIPINECKLLLSSCRQIFHLLNETNHITTNQCKNLSYYGEIKLAIRFVISDYQKIMLHVADEAIELNGTLEVWIKEGKNLHSPKVGTEINSYVTVELTVAQCQTEYRSSDLILRSDQPIWNSLVSFTNKYLSELIKSTMKIFIWNRSSSLNEPELLGYVEISNRGDYNVEPLQNDLLFNVPLLDDYEWEMITNLVLNSIENATDYLWKHRYKVNLDGYLGTRIVESIIQILLKLYQYNMPQEIIERMQLLYGKLTILNDFGVKNIEKQTPYYFSRVGFLLKPQLWNNFYPIALLNYSLKYEIVNKIDSWTEYDCDNCLREFLHKTKDGFCQISNQCWESASDHSETEYTLTHQVFYLMIGIQSNCRRTMNYLLQLNHSGMNTDRYLQQLCTNVAFEAQIIANKDFPVDYRDLFMEQVGFCGLAGFWQICKIDWLLKIISWQSKNGCYHKFYTEKMNPKNFDPNLYGHYKRRKRSEQRLSNGRQACLSHRTSVAITALSGYLRYLIEFH